MSETRRILVVEDSPSTADAYRCLLEALGYRVVLALDGVDGVRAAKNERPDLIVTDYSMPRLNGLEMGIRIREETSPDRVPMILVTALPAAMLPVEARSIFVAVCHKPVPPALLVQTVTRHLTARPGEER